MFIMVVDGSILITLFHVIRLVGGISVHYVSQNSFYFVVGIGQRENDCSM